MIQFTVPTYREASNAWGMLLDNAQCIDTLNDALLTKPPKQIREVFGIITVFCKPSSPNKLYTMLLLEKKWLQTFCMYNTTTYRNFRYAL